LHGHSYRVEVQLDGPVNPRTGFVIDFFDLGKSFAGVLNVLDHKLLNEVKGLENPTAKNIAVWIWDRLKSELHHVFVVRVNETADCWAEYDGR
jgi:6-pyruvoyltetrahydropterin/6-carboxytetrahydropterin synthase